MTPQEKAFEEWKKNSPMVPYDWSEHEGPFKAGFEAGVRYAFKAMGDSMLGIPAQSE